MIPAWLEVQQLWSLSSLLVGLRVCKSLENLARTTACVSCLFKPSSVDVNSDHQTVSSALLSHSCVIVLLTGPRLWNSLPAHVCRSAQLCDLFVCLFVALSVQFARGHGGSTVYPRPTAIDTQLVNWRWLLLDSFYRRLKTF